MAYITIEDIRDLTNVQASEFSDSALQKMADKATAMVDLRTARTWDGVQTVTDELYDGADDDILWMRQCDLQSVTALSIDQVGDNQTYTTVTPSYVNVYREGYLVLNRQKAEVNLFKSGTKTVKVTYTYGYDTPTEDVKQLCLLMVRNFMHSDATRAKEIEQIIQRLKRKTSGIS